jgi:ABC-2 type transport system ATP-binding protein
MYDGSLRSIVDRFAPFRELSIELGREIDEAEISPFGELQSLEGRMAKLIVRREELTGTIGRLFEALPVADLTAADPPIDEIIGRIFRDGMDAEAVGPAEPASASRSAAPAAEVGE